MITDSQSVISVEGRSTALNCCVTSPALFLVANDWILGHLAPDVGITVEHYHFTDLSFWLIGSK